MVEGEWVGRNRRRRNSGVGAQKKSKRKEIQQVGEREGEVVVDVVEER